MEKTALFLHFYLAIKSTDYDRLYIHRMGVLLNSYSQPTSVRLYINLHSLPYIPILESLLYFTMHKIMAMFCYAIKILLPVTFFFS